MSDVLDFPPNPTVGQIFTTPDGTSWIWNGRQWHAAGGGGGGGGPGGGVPEAPAGTGQIYGRGGPTPAWQPVLPLSGFTMQGPIVGYPNANANNPSFVTGGGSGLYPSAGAVGVSAQGTAVFLFTTSGHACMQPLNMFNQRINTLAPPQANHEAVNLGYLLNTYRPNYGQLPPALQRVPLAFTAARLPASGVVSVAIGMAVTVPALSNNVFFYADEPAAADRSFVLRKISGGVESVLGNILITAGSKTNVTGTGAGGSLAPGDAMQIAGPAQQDATLANFGITVMTLRD